MTIGRVFVMVAVVVLAFLSRRIIDEVVTVVLISNYQVMLIYISLYGVREIQVKYEFRLPHKI